MINVADGIKLLDDHFDGERYMWARRVDPNTLDIANPRFCVLGQVFGGFRAGCAALGIDTYDAVYFGMDIPDYAMDDAEYDAEVFAMEEEWRQTIMGA